MKFTFASITTDGAVAHADAFGSVTPEGLPWQLEWPSPDAPQEESAYTCNEYGALLAECVKRGKPVTVKEYADFFWKGDDGVYRGGIEREIATRDYGEFVRLASDEYADL